MKSLQKQRFSSKTRIVLCCLAFYQGIENIDKIRFFQKSYSKVIHKIANLAKS